jgi:hypothetical protein
MALYEAFEREYVGSAEFRAVAIPPAVVAHPRFLRLLAGFEALHRRRHGAAPDAGERRRFEARAAWHCFGRSLRRDVRAYFAGELGGDPESDPERGSGNATE